MPHVVRSARPLILAMLLLAVAGCHRDPPNLYSPGQSIVCFGDSVTAGVGRGRSPAYPDLLARMLGVSVVNAGVPGDTAEQGLARMDTVMRHDPWLVVIEFGGNDILRQVPVDRTEAALSAIVQRVLSAGAVPLLVGVHGPFGGQHEDMFERLSDHYGAPLLPDALPKILVTPALKSDSIHPNGAGYQALANAVAQRIRPWLAARRRAGS